jgi:hypothetical protein
VAVYDVAFCTDTNETVTDAFVCVVTTICGVPSGNRANLSGGDAAPTVDVAKLTPSPIDVIVAVNVSPVVKPENVNVPDVFPVIGVVEFAVVSWNVIVLETAFGSGVNVTLIDDGDTWESVGAGGLANGERTSVRGAEAVPTGEFEYVVPSPIDVIVALYVSPGVSPVKCAVPVVLPVLVVDVDAVVLFSVMVLETAFASGANVTVTDVGVVWLAFGAAGVANGERTSVRGAEAVPTGEFEYVVPSPIDVIVALYVSPGVSPVKCAVPVVLPVLVVDVDAVVLFSVMVLETAFASGANVTVTDVGVVWLAFGAAGVANWGMARVTGDDINPSDESAKVLPSPIEVTVAVYVSPVVSDENENEPVLTVSAATNTELS